LTSSIRRLAAFSALAVPSPAPAARSSGARSSSATARAFGFADRAGSLEPGKDADVVVWSGVPFEPLSQPKAIFIKGEEQPLTSRQLQLRGRHKTLNAAYPPEYR